MCISRMTVTIISRLILNLRYEAYKRSFLSMSEPTIKLPTFFNNSLGDTTQINTQVSRYSSWIALIRPVMSDVASPASLGERPSPSASLDESSPSSTLLRPTTTTSSQGRISGGTQGPP